MLHVDLKKWLKLVLLLFSFLSHRKQPFSSHYLPFIGSSEQLFVVCLLCKGITHLENKVFDSEMEVTNVLFYLQFSPIILGKECAKLSGCLAVFVMWQPNLKIHCWISRIFCNSTIVLTDKELLLLPSILDYILFIKVFGTLRNFTAG